MNNYLGKTFKRTLLFILLAELLSFVGYFFPFLNKAGFFAIVIIVLVLSLKKIEYGIFIILAELFIGSKGYLFFFEHEGFVVSLRIALWLIIMAVWTGKTIDGWRISKKLNLPFIKSEFSPYFGALFIFILWGVASGFLNHNDTGNLFFDMNGWLYFTLILPIYSMLPGGENKEKKKILYNDIFQIFFASTIWLSIKTFILLFIFSHNISSIFYELYRWVRVSGIGEVTQMQGGFYRVFIQSHIFVLIGLFLLILFLSIQIKERDRNLKKIAINSALFLLYLSTIIISLSRSFWIGLFAGLIMLLFILFKQKYDFKEISAVLLVFFGGAVLSIMIIIAIVRFPYPNPIGGFNAADLLSGRATQFSGEAGASSRWALLPELAKKIRQSPILGNGFGTTVTYNTKDPRILESSSGGEYTTYAFEWGWLDIWLKLGFFGLMAYVFLIAKIFLRGIKYKPDNVELSANAGLAIGLIVICAVSIFSPYTNHPLGIGYLMIASALIGGSKK